MWLLREERTLLLFDDDCKCCVYSHCNDVVSEQTYCFNLASVYPCNLLAVLSMLSVQLCLHKVSHIPLRRL